MAYPGYGYGLVGYGHGDYYAYPKYNFEYGVHSPHTGDIKNQWQYRDGGVVKNAYNLKEHDRAISRQDLIADGGYYGGGLAYGRYAGGYYGRAASYANGNNLALAGHYGGLYY
ncbi:hypothetical protein J437_LFUL015567 [Ladona fulva]|uniref:Uncharacterized protein n=1 Tax=Ladona fulva TaxID=123851 RepID=A0A8K0P8R4_LADFU|nr:hypothetical protein J437_LFUL015567 [Ladona fulva]